MDFIWVPDAGEGNSTGSGKDGQGRLLSPQSERRGFGNLIGLLAFVPTVGFVFQNIAALLGTIKSKAPAAKRFIWFLSTQAVACGLLELASLH